MANGADMAKINSNTGNAQIIQQGHTDNGHFGSEISATVKYNRSVKELHINTKG